MGGWANEREVSLMLGRRRCRCAGGARAQGHPDRHGPGRRRADRRSGARHRVQRAATARRARTARCRACSDLMGGALYPFGPRDLGDRDRQGTDQADPRAPRHSHAGGRSSRARRSTSPTCHLRCPRFGGHLGQPPPVPAGCQWHRARGGGRAAGLFLRRTGGCGATRCTTGMRSAAMVSAAGYSACSCRPIASTCCASTTSARSRPTGRCRPVPPNRARRHVAQGARCARC